MTVATPIEVEAQAQRRAARPDFALWRLGFRPFYLVASLFAALSIGLWVAQYAGWLETPYVSGPMGHAHEMIFGFVLAVVTGFLLTAVRNWTGRPTAAGAPLAALVALWVAGRLLVLAPWPLAAAAVDTLFPLAVAVAIGIPLLESRNRRNFVFIILMVAFAALDLTGHLSRQGIIALPERYSVQVALDVIVLIITVIGGRVIPMFTANGVRGSTPRRNGAIEWLAPASIIALLTADLVQLPAPALAAILAFGAIVQTARVWLWRPWQTLRVPLVWVLHAGYLWIPVHLALRALAEAGVLSSPIANHALTAGAIGLLTLGMMTRTARGHSGRPLAADRWEVAAFALVGFAGIMRVLVPWLFGAWYRDAVVASACLWSAAYAIFAIRYWPILTRPRIDGRPG